MKTRRVATILLALFLLGLAGMVYNVGAGAGTELRYDDGSAESCWAWSDAGISNDGRCAVLFTPPITPALVTNAVFYINSTLPRAPLKLHVLDPSFAELLTPPLVIDPAVDWNNVDLTSYGIVVTGDFYIALEWTVGGTSFLGMDYVGFIYDRSWVHLNILTPPWQPVSVWRHTPFNWLLRAVVEEIPLPVIPEYPFGTIMASAAMLIALVAYVAVPKWRGKREYINP